LLSQNLITEKDVFIERTRNGKIKKWKTTFNRHDHYYWFGSHEEMVVEDLGDGKVICEDSRGRYITDKDRLDNGLADQNRASLKRI
jgi:hypothetical protein